MIHNVNLYQQAGGCLDRSAFSLIEATKGSVSTSTIPFKADIGIDHLVIHFKDNDYSFARPYSYEKAYPAKKKKDGKKEKIDPRCFKLTFNNPHDSERQVSFYVSLNAWQSLRFCLYRIIKWFKRRDNILWFVNIIVLILNIIAFFYHKS